LHIRSYLFIVRYQDFNKQSNWTLNDH